jgi:hypothetical protein
LCVINPLVAWDCSAWVRTYALFLEERLECFRVLKYDIETERLTKSPQCSTKVGIRSFPAISWRICFLALRRLIKMLSNSQMQAHSRTRTLPCLDLMEHLPALQQLLFRLMGCQVWNSHVLLLRSYNFYGLFTSSLIHIFTIAA